MVFLDAQIHISQYLPDEGTDDNLGAVIRNYHYLSLNIAKGTMASFSADPMKPSRFSDLAELPISDQAQPGQAITSIRKVPTTSGVGSSSSVVFT